MSDDAAYVADEAAVWPDGMVLEPCGHPMILRANFPDDDAFRARLVAHIDATTAAARPSSLGSGGAKIHHLKDWGLAEAVLIERRALEMFRRAFGKDKGELVDSWANAMTHGEYSMPHSHPDSTASCVYFLALGEPPPDRPLSGRFCFVDPRLDYCCAQQQGSVSRALMPRVGEGSMIIFPSQLVHFVHAHLGRGLRMTIACNIVSRG